MVGDMGNSYRLRRCTVAALRGSADHAARSRVMHVWSQRVADGRVSSRSGLPELDVARVKRFIDERNERVPPEARDKIRYELDIAFRSVTMLECRPPWREGYGTEWTRFPIARLRYVKARKEWSLYWLYAAKRG